MTKDIFQERTHRRGFLGLLAKGAATLGMASLVAPLNLHAESDTISEGVSDADVWFNQIKGKHRIVFDVTEPNDIFPFAWPRIFLVTNEKTGTTEKDCTAVVVLRHAAIPYAMDDSLWAKYKFGEFFKAEDPKTKSPSVRNPFWKPKPGDFKVPGIGEVAIGVNELQASGVMFCVCDAAMTVYSAIMADKIKMEPADLKKEWVAGLLPGIQPVPSGVWAVNRAQEHGCSYCFAG
jgi:intracellular sulfur oxidation DsrE/DsrF family protein